MTTRYKLVLESEGGLYAFVDKAYYRDTSSIGCSYMIRVVTWQDVCEGFLIHNEKKLINEAKLWAKITSTLCSHTTALSNRTRRL